MRQQEPADREEASTSGRVTVPAAAQSGRSCWVQCDACSKWRRLPASTAHGLDGQAWCVLRLQRPLL